MKVINDYIYYELEDSYIIIPISNFAKRKLYKVNSVGFEILKLLEKSSVSEIVKILSKSYNIDENIVFKDVNYFLDLLSDYGIINITSKESSNNKLCQAKCKNENMSNYNLYNEMYGYSTKHRKPFKVFIEITNKCNLKCKHCYKGTALNSDNMSPISLIRYKELLNELKKIGVFDIVFTGGEATLNEDCIDLLRYASKLGFMVTLLTNAQLIDNKFVKDIIDINLFSVKISFYGNEEFHDLFVGKEGSYKQSLSALEEINIAKGIGEATYVVLEDNFKYCDEFKKYLDEKSIGVSFTSLIMPTTYGDMEPKKYALSYENNIIFCEKFITELGGSECNAGISRFRVTPNGDVFPCELLEEYNFGNINQNTFRQILDSKAKSDWEEIILGLKENSYCAKCEINKYCKVCYGLIKLENNTFNACSEYMYQVAKIKEEKSGNQEIKK